MSYVLAVAVFGGMFALCAAGYVASVRKSAELSRARSIAGPGSDLPPARATRPYLA
jgi:hypothetical protein